MPAFALITVVYALVFGASTGLVSFLVTWFDAPLNLGSAVSPASLLAINRTTVLFHVLLVGPVFGLLIALSRWLGLLLAVTVSASLHGPHVLHGGASS